MNEIIQRHDIAGEQQFACCTSQAAGCLKNKTGRKLAFKGEIPTIVQRRAEGVDPGMIGCAEIHQTAQLAEKSTYLEW